MDPWKDGAEILEIVRSWNWTPELFERCKNSILVDPCIFNQIRKVLTTSEYEQFDRMYCEYVNPGVEKMVDTIKSMRKVCVNVNN